MNRTEPQNTPDIMMKTHHHAVLFLAALTAVAGCTSAVSNDPNDPKAKGERATAEPETQGSAPDVSDPKDADAVAKNPVDVAVGSVLLRRDCPDPPVADPSAPASVAPPAPSKRPLPASPGVTAPGAPRPPGVAHRRACEQSTLQISFDNHGAAPAKVSAVQATLRDVETDQVVATLPTRRPSKWSDADNAYAEWDQSLAAGGSVRASYRIKPPSWSVVEGKLDGQPSRGRSYDVEVTLQIDGTPRTARSAEFTRPPVVPMPPT